MKTTIRGKGKKSTPTQTLLFHWMPLPSPFFGFFFFSYWFSHIRKRILYPFSLKCFILIILHVAL